MALTLKQKKVAKNMFFYIAATEKIEALRWQMLNEEENEDLEEMIEFLEEEIEKKVDSVFSISSDFRDNVKYVKEHC